MGPKLCFILCWQLVLPVGSQVPEARDAHWWCALRRMYTINLTVTQSHSGGCIYKCLVRGLRKEGDCVRVEQSMHIIRVYHSANTGPDSSYKSQQHDFCYQESDFTLWVNVYLNNINVRGLFGIDNRCHICWGSDISWWRHQMETFPRYWPFVRWIHRSPLNSLHKGQRRGALMFSLICKWINGCVNNPEAGDLRRHRAHYNFTVIYH